MNVKFYKINKKVNSTLIPSGTGTTYNVVLKSPSSIINPRFELNQYLDVNYCYVAEFNRYYFINEIRYENPLWVYSCNVDVLASFKTEIGSSSKYVLRSASQRNDLILDMSSPLNGEVSRDGENQISPASNFSTGYFVVGVVGNNASGQTLYQLDVNGFRTLLSSLLTTADGYDWGDFTRGMINSIMNPFEYITSCRWYPVSMQRGIPITSINAGLWGCDVSGHIINGVRNADSEPDCQFVFHIKKHPQTNTRGRYVNLNPFTIGMIDLPNFGLINLDMSLLIDMYLIRINIFVDPYTGIATAYGIAEDEEGVLPRRLIFKRQCQYGINIPLSKQDNNGGGSFIAGLVSTGIGIATENPLMIAEGIGESGIGLGQMANSFNGISATTSSIGSIAELLRPAVSYFYFRNQSEIDIVNAGRPLCENKQINTLNGFIICNDGNIVSNATEQEKESIVDYLTRGFYYE